MRNSIHELYQPPVRARRRADDSADFSTVLIIVLLFIAAPAFAITSWGVPYQPTLWRDMAIPILGTEFAIVITLLVTSGGKATKMLATARPLTVILFLAWLLSAITSTWLAQYAPSAARYHLALTCLHVLLAALLLANFSNNNYFRMLLPKIMGLSAGLYIIIVLILSVSVLDSDQFAWPSHGAGVTNVRQFSFYGLLACGIASGLFIFTQSQRQKYLWGLIYGLGVFLILWSGGRGGAGAWLVQTIALFILAPNAARKPLLQLILIVLAITVPIAAFTAPAPQYGFNNLIGIVPDGDDLNGYSSSRLAFWTQTVELIGNKPAFGYGEAQFRWAAPIAKQYYNHPHNSILQLLMQWGFIGTTLFIAWLGTLFLPKMRLIFHAMTEADFAAFNVLLGLGAISLLDGPFFQNYITMISVICLVILLSKPAASSQLCLEQ